MHRNKGEIKVELQQQLHKVLSFNSFVSKSKLSLISHF